MIVSALVLLYFLQGDECILWFICTFTIFTEIRNYTLYAKVYTTQHNAMDFFSTIVLPGHRPMLDALPMTSPE